MSVVGVCALPRVFCSGRYRAAVALGMFKSRRGLLELRAWHFQEQTGFVGVARVMGLMGVRGVMGAEANGPIAQHVGPKSWVPFLDPQRQGVMGCDEVLGILDLGFLGSRCPSVRQPAGCRRPGVVLRESSSQLPAAVPTTLAPESKSSPMKAKGSPWNPRVAPSSQ